MSLLVWPTAHRGDGVAFETALYHHCGEWQTDVPDIKYYYFLMMDQASSVVQIIISLSVMSTKWPCQYHPVCQDYFNITRLNAADWKTPFSDIGSIGSPVMDHLSFRATSKQRHCCAGADPTDWLGFLPMDFRLYVNDDVSYFWTMN
jgi:hypothetical protein